MENKTVDQLLESLVAMVGDARGSIFGQDKVMVDRDQLLNVVDELQSQLPQEIVKSKAVVESCNELRTNAKREAAETRKKADAILADAEKRAAALIEESTIVEFAKKRQDEILEDAAKQRAELIRGAMDYADRIMEEAEASVRDYYDSLFAGVEVLKNRAAQDQNDAATQIAEAREAIRNAASAMQNIESK